MKKVIYAIFIIFLMFILSIMLPKVKTAIAFVGDGGTDVPESINKQNDVEKHLNYFCMHQERSAADSLTVEKKSSYEITENLEINKSIKIIKSENKDNLDELKETWGEDLTNLEDKVFYGKDQRLYAISYVLNQRTGEDCPSRNTIGNCKEQMAIWLINGAGNEIGNYTITIGDYIYMPTEGLNSLFELLEEAQAYGQYCVGEKKNPQKMDITEAKIEEQNDNYLIGPITYEFNVGYSSYGAKAYLKFYAPQIKDVTINQTKIDTQFKIENGKICSVSEFNDYLKEVDTNSLIDVDPSKNGTLSGEKHKKITFDIVIKKEKLKDNLGKAINLNFKNIITANIGIASDNSGNYQAYLFGTTKEKIKSYAIEYNIPEVELKLYKHGTWQVAEPSKTELTGATYTVTAKQGTSNLVSNIQYTDNTNEATITIKPKNLEEITVTITEKTPPAGYRKLAKPIQIKYYWKNNKWEKSIIKNEWNYIEKVSGKWDVNKTEAGTGMYRYEGTGTPYDHFYFNSDGNYIRIYNEPIPIKLKLEKYNSYNASEKKKLNAEFKVTVKQEGNDDTNTTIKVKEGEMFIDGGKVDKFKIQPKNTNEVYVTIEETTSPKGYKPIDKISIKYVLKRFSLESYSN